MISHAQLREIRTAFQRHGVDYLFIGKSGAILHGFPDTTQDADVFPLKNRENGRALVNALRELGFEIDDAQRQEIVDGKDFVQVRNGPFDVDLVFAPDGIESFEQAWARGQMKEDCPVCSLDDIIASKRAANRARDRESLPRLSAFRTYLSERGLLAGQRLPRRERRPGLPKALPRSKAEQAAIDAADKAGTPRERERRQTDAKRQRSGRGRGD